MCPELVAGGSTSISGNSVKNQQQKKGKR